MLLLLLMLLAGDIFKGRLLKFLIYKMEITTVLMYDGGRLAA